MQYKKRAIADQDGLSSGKLRAAEIFKRSGFLGVAEGPEDLSTRYKEYLTKDLASRT